jgi:pre-rRNA-processing protein TSR3
MQFFIYPKHTLPLLETYIILDLNAPPLTIEDAHLGLLLIDGTWRHAETMTKNLPEPLLQTLIPRSLPSQIKTAYPRRQTLCSDPERGLASIEALFISYHILQRDTTGLLDHYHWKDLFLSLNQI